jgi:flagellar hook-length control protein FliK
LPLPEGGSAQAQVITRQSGATGLGPTPPVAAVSTPLQGAISASPASTPMPAPAQIEWQDAEVTLESAPQLRGTIETQTTPRGQPEHVLARSDLPRAVSQQLVEALRLNASRQAELHLNPTELGRVRISLQTTDGNVTVHISADRSETLDLMRRNMDLLAQDFRDSGLGNAKFSFSDHRPNDERGEFSATVGTPESEAIEPDEASSGSQTAVALHMSDHIDIRI